MSQLELTAAELDDATEAPATIRVDLPVHLVKLLGRLEPSARAELDQRLPVAVHQAYAAIAEVRSLTADELLVRLAIARRDVERLQAEMTRRASSGHAGPLATSALDPT